MCSGKIKLKILVCKGSISPAPWKKWIKSCCTQQSYPSAGEMDEPSAKMGLYIKLYSTFPSPLFIRGGALGARISTARSLTEVWGIHWIENKTLYVYTELGDTPARNRWWDVFAPLRPSASGSCLPQIFIKRHSSQTQICIRFVWKRSEIGENVKVQIMLMSFNFW